jgi:hypothetical protein
MNTEIFDYNILLFVTLILLLLLLYNIIYTVLWLRFINGNTMVHSSNLISMNGPITKINKIFFFQIVTDEFDFCKVAKS